MADQCIKYEDPSFSCSRYILGGIHILNGSHDVTMPLSGRVCHLWAGTCYDQSAYQIWSCYVHPLWRYKRQCKM